jgi:hypothetical protein
MLERFVFTSFLCMIVFWGKRIDFLNLMEMLL